MSPFPTRILIIKPKAQRFQIFKVHQLCSLCSSAQFLDFAPVILYWGSEPLSIFRNIHQHALTFRGAQRSLLSAKLKAVVPAQPVALFKNPARTYPKRDHN